MVDVLSKLWISRRYGEKPVYKVAVKSDKIRLKIAWLQNRAYNFNQHSLPDRIVRNTKLKNAQLFREKCMCTIGHFVIN